MRLLITTQAVDTNDPVMGFFVEWLLALSNRFEHIHVICLKKGAYTLPPNVSVHSLGKPSFAKAMKGEGSRAIDRLKYTMRFYRYSWNLRGEYDSVFVHMNQEYVLLAGALWKALGRKVYLWRNHIKGSFLTNIAVSFST